jgi:phenylacetate-CoA ligase
MQDFRTTALIGIPSYALQIAHAMEEVGVDANSLSLRVGVFGGEPWSQRTREEIEERLRIRTTDIYGLSEVGGPGVSGECEHRCGLHIAEDHFIAEIIDPATGEPLGPGEEGELVFTTVHKEGMPVLRYRTGDVSSLDFASCACGRTFARMSCVNRRTDEMVIIHGRNVFPEDIAAVIEQVEGLGPHFRMFVDREQAEDTLEVQVELSSILPEDTIRSIERLSHELAERLLRVFGFETAVRISEPKSLSPDGERHPIVLDRRER